MRRLLPLLLALALLLGGCHHATQPPSPTPSPSPTLPSVTPTPAPVERALVLPFDPDAGWNPYNGVATTNLSLLGLMAQGLTRLDDTFTPHLDLAATAAESENGLTWTFTLQEATFSDGTPLTAALAAGAVNAARTEPSLYASRLSGIRRVTGSEDGVLTISLTAPNHNLLALLDFPLVINTEAGALGTGPYRLEGDRLGRNPFWTGAVPTETISLFPVADSDDLLAAFQVGNVSLAPMDLASPNAASPGQAQVWEYPTTQLLFMGFQCNFSLGKDPLFRQAVSQALNRANLVSTTLNGHGVAASLPAHPASGLHVPRAASALDYDPMAAATLLDSLGYTLSEEDGLRYNRRAPITLTLLVCQDSALQTAVGDWVVAQLAGVGITLQVNALPKEEYQTALEKGQFDLYLGEARLTADGDVSAFLTKDGPLAYGVADVPELRDALAEAKKTGDFATFYDLWAQTPTCAPLAFQSASVLTHWGGVQPTGLSQGNLFADFLNWTL